MSRNAGMPSGSTGAGGGLGFAIVVLDARQQADQAKAYIIAIQDEKERILWRQSAGLPLGSDHLAFMKQVATVQENETGEFRPMTGEGVGRTVVASLNGLVATGARVTGGILRDVPGSEILLGQIPGVGGMRQQIGQNMIEWSKDADKWSEREKLSAARSIGETGVAITDFVTTTAVMMVVTMGIGSLGSAAGRMMFVGGRWIMAGSRAASAVEVAGSSLALGTFGYLDASDKSWDERLINATAMALGPLFGNKGGPLRKMAAGFISNMAIDAGQLSYQDVFKHYATTGDAKGAGEATWRVIGQNKGRLFMSGLMGLTAGFSGNKPKERASIEVDGKIYDWSFTGREVVEAKAGRTKETIKLSTDELTELRRAQKAGDFETGETVVSRAASRDEQIELGDQTLTAVDTEIARLAKAKSSTENDLALTAANDEKTRLGAQQQVTKATVDGTPIPRSTMETANTEIPPGYRLEGEVYKQNAEAFKIDNAKLRDRAMNLALGAKEYQAAIKQMDGATTDLLASKTAASRTTNRTKLDEQAEVAKQKLEESKLTEDTDVITVETAETKAGVLIENGFQVDANKVPLEGPNGWLLDNYGKEVDSKGRRRDAGDRILAVNDKGEVIPDRFLDNEGRPIDESHKLIDETGKLLTSDEVEARYPELSSKPVNGKLEDGTEVGMSGKELSGGSGGTADVWEGWIGDRPVVVKALRASNSEVDTRAAFDEARDLHVRLGGAQPIGIATFERGGRAIAQRR